MHKFHIDVALHTKLFLEMSSLNFGGCSDRCLEAVTLTLKVEKRDIGL